MIKGKIVGYSVFTYTDETTKATGKIVDCSVLVPIDSGVGVGERALTIRGAFDNADKLINKINKLNAIGKNCIIDANYSAKKHCYYYTDNDYIVFDK